MLGQPSGLATKPNLALRDIFLSEWPEGEPLCCRLCGEEKKKEVKHGQRGCNKAPTKPKKSVERNLKGNPQTCSRTHQRTWGSLELAVAEPSNAPRDGVIVPGRLLAVWLIGWLAGWLVGWLAGWLVGWWAGWLVSWLLGCLVGWLKRAVICGNRS